MTPNEIVASVEVLPHTARMRRLVALGAIATQEYSDVGETTWDPSVAQTFAQMAHGDWYERLLALQSVSGSGASA